MWRIRNNILNLDKRNKKKIFFEHLLSKSLHFEKNKKKVKVILDLDKNYLLFEDNDGLEILKIFSTENYDFYATSKNEILSMLN